MKPILPLITLLAILLPATADAWIKVLPEFDSEPMLATTFYSILIVGSPFFLTSGLGVYTTDERDLAEARKRALVRAREDAAAFVASDGSIRGARLEAALRMLRRMPGSDAHDDRQLAEGILAYRP